MQKARSGHAAPLPTPSGHGPAEPHRPEDYDLWLRLAKAGRRFGKLPEVLYAWRERAGRLTRTDPRYA